MIIPGAAGGPSGAPFDKEFFRRELGDDHAPVCSLADEAEVAVVELVLANGETRDVERVLELRRDLLVADVFEDPPDCRRLFRAYVRYDTILGVNVRTYRNDRRTLGFKSGAVKLVE